MTDRIAFPPADLAGDLAEDGVDDEALALATRVTQRLRDSQRLHPGAPAGDGGGPRIGG